MSNQNVALAIRDFFTKNAYAGLVLPNGWFGRPHDNMLQLTEVEALNGTLVVVLEENLKLTFHGDIQVLQSDGKVTISNFAILEWDWTEFGSNVRHHKVFAAGSVELVA